MRAGEIEGCFLDFVFGVKRGVEIWNFGDGFLEKDGWGLEKWMGF